MDYDVAIRLEKLKVKSQAVRKKCPYSKLFLPLNTESKCGKIWTRIRSEK